MNLRDIPEILDIASKTDEIYNYISNIPDPEERLAKIDKLMKLFDQALHDLQEMEAKK